MKKSIEYSHLQIPRNVLASTADFDYFEWSVIIALIERVQEHMSFKNEDIEGKALSDILLPFKAICPKNENRGNLYERLLALRRKDIRYRSQISGVSIEVVTGLFSSVIKAEKGGGVYVCVSREVVPWLIALEKGYSLLDKNVFWACKSIYVRRLYILVCSQMYRDLCSFTLPLQIIRTALNCPASDTSSLIMNRYVNQLQKILNGLEPRFAFEFRPQTEKGFAGAGRKKIDSITVNYVSKNTKNKNNDYEKTIQIIRECYRSRNTTDLRNWTEVVNEVCENKMAMQILFESHKRYKEKLGDDRAHIANTLFLILKDRCGIDVHKKIADGETK